MIRITLRFFRNIFEKNEKNLSPFCNEYSESSRQWALWSGKSFFYVWEEFQILVEIFTTANRYELDLSNEVLYTLFCE